MKELLYLKDEQLKEFIEKIYMSYRETFSDAKKVLDKYSIGVAHHKVINLISLYDGITISELLKKLKITKQSLNRVLKDLIKLEVVDFKKDKKDTRLKHVYLNDKGKKLFTKCKACHNAEKPQNKVGPHLVGIVGRKAASADGYKKYSKDLKEAGIVWDEANLDKWLTNPKGMYPGTKMIYPGLKKAEDRANVIEYLKTK